jgi:V-type H+-transporting ATPase subunit d
VEHRQFEFVHFAQQASDPLMTVLQYIAHTYMIDNVILIMTGALHGRSFEELAEKCHPLGLFDSIENLMIANDIRDIHRIVLVDTPVSTYFTECLGYGSLDEANLEMVRSCAYKVNQTGVCDEIKRKIYLLGVFATVC